MKWLAMTRVFRLGSILKFALPAAAALMAAAFWAGVQWQEGRQAQATLRVISTEQEDADRVTAHQHQAAVDYESRRAERAETRRVTDAELRGFIEARPDLWGCDVGADGLRLIRSWDAPAARADPAESSDPVSNTAAKPGLRPGAGSVGQHEGKD